MAQTRVLVGTDGSASSEAAIKWAVAEAAARGSHLRLVHAFVWPLFPVALGPSEVAPGLRAAADRIVRESVELAQKIDPGVKVEGVRVDGFPSPVLIEASRQADLLVIGSRGLGGTLSVLAGSTGLDLAANAHCPVVVVRRHRPGEAGTRVVVGYDGSPASIAALDFGLAHARRHGLAVRVVAVQPPHTDHDRVSQPDLATEVHSREGGLEAELVHVDGHPAEQLLRLSADAKLVAVGSRGRGGFTGMLLGSVSQALLHHADCPVAVIPHAVVESRG
ncbi:MAG TPA: universal stress protein [Kribbella sp.]|nr:universal stress protein [Kribbella sp.]